MILRSLAFGLGAVAFFAVNWWLLRSPDAPADTEAAPAVQQFGWYLRGATLVATDDAGAQRYRLSARVIEQNPADDSAALTDVRLRYEAGADPAWQLTARDGWIAPDGRTIRLEGNVVMTDEPDAGATPTVVRTERVDLDVDRDLASSAETVRVENGRNFLSALGMVADLSNDRVQLQSEVSGTFFP